MIEEEEVEEETNKEGMVTKDHKDNQEEEITDNKDKIRE